MSTTHEPSEVCSRACSISGASCVSSCYEALLEPKTVSLQQLGMALGLLVLSGLFSGLTLGLMSLDVRQLELTISSEDRTQRAQAQKILPLRQRGNLLLCTLLLGNTLVNAGIAILTASFTNGVLGAFFSTAFILIFGEIIPQSVCSRHGLAAGAKTVDIVRVMIVVLFPVAWPLSKVLDKVLGAEIGTIYSREELKELFSMQAKRAATGDAARGDGSGGASSSDAEGIHLDEATYMCGVLSMSERTAVQIMTPLADVFALYTDERLDFPLMSRIYASGFTRIPIFRRRRTRQQLAAAAAAAAVSLGEDGGYSIPDTSLTLP